MEWIIGESKGRMIMNKVKNYPTYLDYPKPHKPITNADRIRAMSDEELEKMLTVGKGAFACFECREIGDGECSMKCDERCLEWLQQPAEEDNHADRTAH